MLSGDGISEGWPFCILGNNNGNPNQCVKVHRLFLTPWLHFLPEGQHVYSNRYGIEISETQGHGWQAFSGSGRGQDEPGAGFASVGIIAVERDSTCVSRLLVSGWWRALRRKPLCSSGFLQGDPMPGFARFGSNVLK